MQENLPPPSPSRKLSTFHQLLGNNLFASTSTTIAWFAITFWAFLQTGSVIVTTVMGLLFTLGNLIGGLVFGPLVDRYDRKKLMVITDWVTASLFLVSLLLYLSTPAEAFTQVTEPRLWLLILIVFVAIMLPNLRIIAQMSVVSSLVPADELDRANGLVGVVSGLAFLIGSLFSGFLISLAGMTLVLLIPIIVRGFTVLHLSFLAIPKTTPAAHPSDGAAPGAGEHFDLRNTLRIVRDMPGLLELMLFNCLNNLLSGVYIVLLDPYGLSLMSVEAWGVFSGLLGLGFLLGGAIIARRGLGSDPLRSMFLANLAIWASAMLFTIQPSIVLLGLGYLLFPVLSPFIEAAEQTIIQRIVPPDRQGRVFGFAQAIESASGPVSTLVAGPLAVAFFIPFMVSGAGVDLLGPWFGTGEARGMALMFTVSGLAGVIFTLLAMRSRAYQRLRQTYFEAAAEVPEPALPVEDEPAPAASIGSV